MSPTGPIWRVGKEPKPLQPSKMDSEQQLEEMLVADMRILSPEWMYVGNQVQTGTGRIDILAVARDGTLVVVELKRHETSRDVVAQTLDYLSWAAEQTPESIEALYAERHKRPLADALAERFGPSTEGESLDGQQLAVIVASEPNSATERMVKYLSKMGVPINLNTFEVFRDETGLLLRPNWLINLTETELDSGGGKQPWNLQYYGSFGHGEDQRSWEDAVQYGFFSAGGGRWYSQTLDLLEPGSIMWVLAPSFGYVGVGRTTTKSMPFDEFTVVNSDGKDVLLKDQPLKGRYNEHSVASRGSVDADIGEYVVGIQWIHTVALSEAVKKPGLFGNQNSVCRPRSAKWLHTVNELMAAWKPDLGL